MPSKNNSSFNTRKQGSRKTSFMSLWLSFQWKNILIKNWVYIFNWAISHVPTLGIKQITYLATWLISFPSSLHLIGMWDQNLERAQGFLRIYMRWWQPGGGCELWDIPGSGSNLPSCSPENKVKMEQLPLEWLVWGPCCVWEPGHWTPPLGTLHVMLQASPATGLVLMNLCPQWTTTDWCWSAQTCRLLSRVTVVLSTEQWSTESPTIVSVTLVTLGKLLASLSLGFYTGFLTEH